MKKKLFDLHKEWMEKESISRNGLCKSLPPEYIQDFKMFEPTQEYINELMSKNLAFGYWGYEGSKDDDASERCYGYNAFRQTIVLLICAMNNEL